MGFMFIKTYEDLFACIKKKKLLPCFLCYNVFLSDLVKISQYHIAVDSPCFLFDCFPLSFLFLFSSQRLCSILGRWTTQWMKVLATWKCEFGGQERTSQKRLRLLSGRARLTPFLPKVKWTTARPVTRAI